MSAGFQETGRDGRSTAERGAVFKVREVIVRRDEPGELRLPYVRQYGVVRDERVDDRPHARNQ